MSGQTIGFIGLGNMGRPMAEHLIAGGHTLRVYARRAEALRPLVARGGHPCTSPADAARGAAVVITNVTATADVAQVLFGTDGVVEGAASGTVVIDHGTISAAATREFAQRLGERGIEMLDCPVSGGVKGAQAARLTMMVGGRADVLE